MVNTSDSETLPARRPNQRRGRNNERQRGPKLEIGEGPEQQSLETTAPTAETTDRVVNPEIEAVRPPRRDRAAPAAGVPPVDIVVSTEDSSTVAAEAELPPADSQPAKVDQDVVANAWDASVATVVAGMEVSEAPVAEELEMVAKVEPVASPSSASKEPLVDHSKSYVRPANDPRANPKPVTHTEVANVLHSVSRTRPLDTSLPVSIERNPRPLARPANDPRVMGARRTDTGAFAG